MWDPFTVLFSEIVTGGRGARGAWRCLFLMINTQPYITGHLWDWFLVLLHFVLNSSIASARTEEYRFCASLFFGLQILAATVKCPSRRCCNPPGSKNHTHIRTPLPPCINYASTKVSNVSFLQTPLQAVADSCSAGCNNLYTDSSVSMLPEN